METQRFTQQIKSLSMFGVIKFFTSLHNNAIIEFAIDYLWYSE